jgi:hypothetical protein
MGETVSPGLEPAGSNQHFGPQGSPFPIFSDISVGTPAAIIHRQGLFVVSGFCKVIKGKCLALPMYSFQLYINCTFR